MGGVVALTDRLLRLPDQDTHFAIQKHPEKYQRGVFEAALPHVKSFDLGIDIGAHVGIWTRYLEEKFDKVVAFEPERSNVRCLRRNTNARVYEFPLSDGGEALTLQNPTPGNSGAWEVRQYRNQGTPLYAAALDWFELSPGLIKIDVQGYELRVLRGAEKTIRKHKPVIVCECWRDRHRWAAPEEMLISFGAKRVETVGKDLIFAWSEHDV